MLSWKLADREELLRKQCMKPKNDSGMSKMVATTMTAIANVDIDFLLATYRQDVESGLE